MGRIKTGGRWVRAFSKIFKIYFTDSFMTLFTKCILKPEEPSDGIRISVMSRHTLNDGVTPDIRINPEMYDEHQPTLAPSPILIGSYRKRGLAWEEFAVKYLDYIRAGEVIIEVQSLAQRSLKQNVTLLCIEETARYCHRRLLAEECKRYEPDLRIVHL